MAQEKRVGVVTNDQGKYLVDTSFVRFSDVPTVEVTGGCFCCNYTDLDGSLDQLIQSVHPDVIFAESVGSCADLVATVVKPLLHLKQALSAPTSFSVFADARLLRRRLRGDPMPFSEDVVYIFDKQIEEAGLLVVNKIDLLSAEKLAEVAGLLKAQYPGKWMLEQSSLSDQGVSAWVNLLGSGVGLLPDQSLEIDYARYANGEAQLAWLDEIVILRGPDLSLALRQMVTEFVTGIGRTGHAIGHVKFLIVDGEKTTKLSLPSLDLPGWEQAIPPVQAEELRIVVNARVEMPAAELRGLFKQCLEVCGASFSEDGVRFFHPRQPIPEHRYA